MITNIHFYRCPGQRLYSISICFIHPLELLKKPVSYSLHCKNELFSLQYKKEKMDLTKYAFFKNYMASEFQLTCYHFTHQQRELEHFLLQHFDMYDDDYIFEKDGGLSILLPTEHVKNATSIHQFTNFNQVIELSKKFVNVQFVYSIQMTCLDEEDVEIFVDVYIENGVVTGDKCVGCVFDDSIVD